MLPSSGLQILEIEITNNCNLDCKHCYVDKDTRYTLDKNKVIEIIDQASDLGVYRLVFTGGEPLLIPSIFDFASYAKSKKISQVVLMTNGLLITEKNIEKLKIFDLVQLSIDAPPREKPSFRIDYFKQLESTISLLKKANINVHLQATLHKSLIPKMKSLIHFAIKKGASIGFNKLFLIGNAKEMASEKLNPLELKKTLRKLMTLKKNKENIRCSDPLYFLVDKDKLEFFKKSPKKNIIGGCIAGIAAIYIKSNGEVLICPFVKFPIANIFQDSLENIWLNNPILNKLRNRENLNGKCKSCQYRSFCGGCRGASLLSSGSLFNSDPNCWL